MPSPDGLPARLAALKILDAVLRRGQTIDNAAQAVHENDERVWAITSRACEPAAQRGAVAFKKEFLSIHGCFHRGERAVPYKEAAPRVLSLLLKTF